MKFKCPHCNQLLVGDPESAGQVVECPSCNKSMTIPAAPRSTTLGGRLPKSETPSTPAESAPPPKSRRHAKHSDATNVNLLVTGAWALLGTLVFYAVLWPLKGAYLYSLFYQRGWIPPCEAFLMFWAIAFLVYKQRKIRRQQQCLLLDLLPDEAGNDITPDNVNLFIHHIRNLPIKPNESFLINRVLRALEHFRVRNSNPEVANVLSSQSDIDANTMQASYTVLKVFIWAIPILGFIGTVQGLGSAVGGFAGGIDKAADVSVLKNSLTSITVGLAVAFDTTLIALVMSVCLMFPTSHMQKAEEDLLSKIDDYCNDNLLKRLKESPHYGGAPREGVAALSPEELRAAVEAVLHALSEELQHWTAALQSLSGEVTQQLSGVAEKHLETIHALQQAQEHMVALQHKQAEDMQQLVAGLQATLHGISDKHIAVHNLVASSVEKSGEALRDYFRELRTGMGELRDELKRLREMGASLPTPRRRWWRLGRK